MQKKQKIFWISGVCIIVIAIVFLFVAIMQPKESYTSSQMPNDSMDILYCKSSTPIEPYLKNSLALTNLYEIKYTFEGNRTDQASFTYRGTFANEEDTKAGITTMHASHDFLLQDANIDVITLKPTYTASNTEGIMTLFFALDKLNSITGKLLFLQPEEVAKINKYTKSELREIYHNKGFSCQIINK